MLARKHNKVDKLHENENEMKKAASTKIIKSPLIN